MNWYTKVVMMVRWDNCYFSPCNVKSGVRQGSVLSPVLFNVYFSVIVDSLEKAALWCEFYDKYIGCIVYADDVILLSSSVVKLQKTLDICYDTGLELDVVFNGKKNQLCLRLVKLLMWQLTVYASVSYTHLTLPTKRIV